ncbi:MAG: hypothetical protein WAU77_07380 [Solirubrobacteraceae bacterium]
MIDQESASLGRRGRMFYPTVDTFRRALLKAQKALRTDLGVCSRLQPSATSLRGFSKHLPMAT